MKNLCIVYALKNKINNKIYTGQTWKSLCQRWNGGTGYNECFKIYNAIKKYGKENFYYQVLTFCGTQETADYWECFFINKYNSINNGYNIKTGGSRGKLSEESKKKLSKIRKGENNPFYGKHHSEEHNNKISESMKGSNNHFYGKTHSENLKKELSKMKVGNKNPMFGKYKLTIEQISEAKILRSEGKSYIIISKIFNCSTDTIRRSINK